MAVESLSGHWWEPKAPDRKLAGTLEVAEDGSMALTVSGMMPVAEVIQLAAEPLEVVFGELQDGRCVTLADAIGGFPSAARGKVWSQVLPELALVGERHVADPTESPAFNGVIAQVAGRADT